MADTARYGSRYYRHRINSVAFELDLVNICSVIGKNKRNRLAHTLSGLGILITIIGWLLPKAESVPWLQSMFSGSYRGVQGVIAKIRTSEFSLKSGDPCFDAISQILKEQIDQEVKPRILEIKTTGWGQGSGTDDAGLQQGEFHEFDAHLHNGQVLHMLVWHLDRKLLEGLHSRIARFSDTVFWSGIIVGVVGLVSKMKMAQLGQPRN